MNLSHFSKYASLNGPMDVRIPNSTMTSVIDADGGNIHDIHWVQGRHCVFFFSFQILS
ncbi:hypothetical protein MUK42_32947 [Musa troglodytarum]|uniref:Uncharacterized protein n=1 Tax=Musa troglodytarum TaxID=320322 RepID=A0A9E7IBK6_9LILI|nr:hypothetical protein MUK42_32947 [Musa troglodytarum]